MKTISRIILVCLAVVCLCLLSQTVFAQYQSITVPAGWDLTGCQIRESTHFRLVWGTTGPQSYMMTEDYINGNLNMLENMWNKWFGTGAGQMGFREFNIPAPPRNQGIKYKVTLYVGQTGQTMDDAGGCWCGYDDPTGLPFVHGPADSLRYDPPSGATPHEFGHAYENSAFGFSGNTPSGPWWECFANWMMLQFNQTYPNTWEFKVNSCFYPGHGRYYYFHWPIFELLKDKAGYGYPYMNRLWTEANQPNEWIMNAMIRLDQSSAPDKTIALKDNYGEMAKKTVTWDYDPAHRQAMLDGDTNEDVPRCGTCYLVREPGNSTWWRVPASMAPQQYALNIIPLSMPGKSGSSWTVTTSFSPLIDAARGTDFRVTLVAVNDSGTPRYSSTWTTGDNSITLSSTENKLYLVVCATPTLMQVNTFANPRDDERSLPYRQNPYKVSFSNAAPADWVPTRPNQAYHTHTNGGGWVANSATVDATAYVGPNATVQDVAQVRGNARIEDYAKVQNAAIVRDNAVVSGHGWVKDTSIVQNYAKVRDYAVVYGATNVSGDAKVIGYARVPGTTSIAGTAVVKGFSMTPTNSGTINGDSIWDFGSMTGLTTSHGIVCGWVADAPYTTANPANLYCEYDFETTHPFWAWDKYGWTHGYLQGNPASVTDYKTARGKELQLNGTSQWVEVLNDVSDFRDITVAIWAYTASTTTNQRLVSFGNGSNKYMYITPRDSSTGKVRFVISNGTTTQYIDGAAPLLTNGWQHVAVTLSGNTGKLFVNGALVGTNNSLTIDPDQLNGANTPSAGNWNFIGRGNSGNYFNGKVDDFRVYSNAQSDATIATLGAGGDVGTTTYTITASAGTGGTISPTGAVVVNSGANQAFTITPTTGYKISSVTVDGTNQGAISTYTFNNVTANHTIAAAFTSLGRNIPQSHQLLKSAITDTFPASGNTGNWASYLPAGETFTAMASPTVQTINGRKWESNIRTEYDGYDCGTYSSSIACNGASVVVAVKPIRTGTDDNWRSVVDVFYDRLVLGVMNGTGKVCVRRNGSLDFSTATIPDGQATILSLVCQSDGKYKVWANGTEIMNVTTTSTMTSLVPNVAGPYANHINFGRNNPDGWTTYHGNIGDVFLYKVALSDTERQALEADLTSRFAGPTTYTITASAGTGGTISPTGAVVVNSGANQAFAITPNTGYRISSVTVDGTNQGAINTYTFSNVTANHTIAAAFTSLGRNVPKSDQLLFSCVTDSFPASGATGNWATFCPTGQTLTAMASPTVETINSKKWDLNLYADGDGYNYGNFASPIPCNGATIVVAVKPVRNTTSTPWTSIVDAFYNNLVLGIHNDTGEICVYRNGTLNNTGVIIPNGQLTVLSLVVQSDGTYKVFANGSQVVNVTTTSTYTQIAPGTETYMHNINVGRNNPDGWTTFNGDIGDVFFYRTALSDADRATLESDIGTKFGIPVGIPQQSQLIFSCVTDTFPASGSTGAWASYLPAGQTYNMMNTPIVETISSKKWEQNRYADGDGYDVGTYASSIACTGASIVVAIRPTRTADSGNWRSVVDIFYDRLVLGLHNNDGIINVRRNGSLDVNTTAIPDNQLTVLSLVCQSDGKYKVWANGTLVMDVTTTSTMTSLVPGVAGGFANHINIGRNNPDGWSTYNGNIGDVYAYKIALTDTERQQLESSIRSKFGF